MQIKGITNYNWTPDLSSRIHVRDLRLGPSQEIADFKFEISDYNVEVLEYYVYILAGKRNGTLYAGMANDIAKRVVRHKGGRGSKFVQKYGAHNLVYYEKVIGYLEARKRERQLKWWKRKWKLALIEQMNPNWIDLSEKMACHR